MATAPVSKKTSLKTRKKSFSSFDLKAAFKQLGLQKLQPWTPEFQVVEPSEFYYQTLRRLEKFDLRSNERSKELLIDLILQETIQDFDLKIWKGAALESETTAGEVDYLITEDRDYLEAPLLCVIEAKKDDFEQGLAQCLVEMQACQWSNWRLDRHIDILGIVSNGSTWEFYKLTTEGVAYGTLPFSIGEIAIVLGLLQQIMGLCQHSASHPQTLVASEQ
jgi:hypothetical protein